MYTRGEWQSAPATILLGSALFAAVLVLPFAAGRIVGRFCLRDPVSGMVCLFLSLILLAYFIFHPIRTTYSSRYCLLWLALYLTLLGQILYWGIAAYRSILRRESTSQFNTALVAFIVSDLLAIMFNSCLALLFIFVSLLIIGIHYAISGKARRLSAITPGREFEEFKLLGEVGYLPYPAREPPYANPKIVENPTLAAKAFEIEFRCGDRPEHVLGFYKQCAERTGLRGQIGALRHKDSELRPVPAMIAYGGKKSAMIVSQEAASEFLWKVIVLIGTLPAFEDVVKLFSKGETVSPEFGRHAMENTGHGELPEDVKGKMEPKKVLRLSPPPPPPPPRKKFDWGELETKAGIWGARIGAFIVVVGLGYLLSLGFKALGPAGKIVAVYAACFLMLGLGIFFEPKEKYSNWAKAMIAGGWAGLYIATFLLHYLPAPLKLIEDPSIDVFLLMGIATGMIIHSLRYKSQTLTAITYFIAFATIVISIKFAYQYQTFFSLIATAVLAVSILFIIRKMQWYWLAVFGTIACYVTYFIWLLPWIPFFRARIYGSEFWTGLSILIIYWLIFNISSILTKPKTSRREALTLGIAAINYFLFVLIARYHLGTEHRELAWYFFAVLAAAYAILSYLAYSWKYAKLYTLFLILGVLSTTMAMYFGLLGGNWVSIGWLLQAEALYIAGLLGDEKRFRRIAIALFVLVGFWLIAYDYFLTDKIYIFGFEFYKRTLIYFTAALLFYINAVSRHALAFRIEKKHYYSYIFSYAASILVFIIVARNWFPNDLLKAGVICAFLGLILMETGIRNRDPHFRLQGLSFALLGLIAALAPLSDPYGLYYTENIYYRIGCEAAVAILVFIAFAKFQRLVISKEETITIETGAAIFLGLATLVAALLLYREFDISAPVWLILAWMFLGVILVEIGIAIREPFLRVPGYLVTVLTLVWGLYLFIDEPSWMASGRNHLFSFSLVIIGFFYLFARVIIGAGKETPAFTKSEVTEVGEGSGPLLALFFSLAGTVILLLLLRLELVREWPLFVGVAWIITGAVLFEVGALIKNPFLRLQAYSISVITLVWVLYPFIDKPEWFSIDEHYRVALGLVIIGFYYLFARVLICTRNEKSGFTQSEVTEVGEGSGPLLALFFSLAGTVILLLLLRLELVREWPLFVGVAWMITGAVLFEVGAAIRYPFLRFQAYIISVLSFLWVLYAFIKVPEWFSVDEHYRVALGLVIIGFYYLFVRALVCTRNEKSGFTQSERKGTWVGSGPLITGLLSFYGTLDLILLLKDELIEVPPHFVSVAWILSAVILLEIGIAIRSQPLQLQSLGTAGLTFIYALLHNLGHEVDIGPFSERLVTLLIIIVALYYIHERRYLAERRKKDWPAFPVATRILSWLPATLLVILIHQELEILWPAWVGTAWLIPATALCLIGLRRGSFSFLAQSLTLSVVIFFWTLIRTLAPPGLENLAKQIENQRIFAVSPVIIAYYCVFVVLNSRWKSYIKTEKEPYIAFIRDAFSWLATILLVALITVEVNAISDVSEALTTVFWIGLGILLFEVGSAIGNSSFKSQGFLLAIATVSRAVLINLDAPYGTFLFTTGRVASVALVALGLYYFCFRLNKSKATTAIEITENQLGSLMSYLATGLIALLCYRECRPLIEWVPVAWAGLILFVLFMGFLLKDRHFIYQALILVLPVTVGIIAWDLPLHGTPIGRLTTGYAIGLLFAARFLWHVAFFRFRKLYAGAGDDSGFLARTSRHFFSLPAAALLAVYLPLEFTFTHERSKYLTIAWAIEGLILMVSGFGLNDRIMRFFGLGILAVCVVRVFYDVAILHIETPYKVLALIGLGTILIITGWIYSHYHEQIMRRFMSEED